jgi:hypothetical protein
MTGATSGARTVYSSGAAEFIPIFSWFMLLNFLFFVDHYFWPFFLFIAFLQITSSDYALVSSSCKKGLHLNVHVRAYTGMIAKIFGYTKA